MTLGPLQVGNQPHVPVYIDALEEGARLGKYFYMGRCAVQPLNLQYGTQASPTSIAALSTAAADGINVLHLGNSPFNNVIEMRQTTAQTIHPLVHATKGLEIGCDKVDNETVEYCFGGNRASNPLGVTVGTDKGILIEVTFEIADVSGMDQFGLLLRKQEAYTAATSFLTTGDALYTDFVLFGFAATAANPNPVNISTDLNNSGSATVSTAGFTWADGGIHKLSIYLKGRTPRFFINGVELGGRVAKDALGTAITAQQTLSRSAFQFDLTDFLIPGIFLRHDATSPGAVYIREALVCQLVSAGRDNESR
jgi:hypothetical protein